MIIAAEHGNERLARMLPDAVADSALRDHGDHAAAFIAQARGHFSLAGVLSASAPVPVAGIHPDAR